MLRRHRAAGRRTARSKSGHEFRGDLAQRVIDHGDDIPGLHPLGLDQRAEHHHIAREQRSSPRGAAVREPAQDVKRVAQDVGADAAAYLLSWPLMAIAPVTSRRDSGRSDSSWAPSTHA
jgi:hypothetical protein